MSEKFVHAFAFAFILVLYLATVWVFDYFPSQDGPAHVSTAATLANLGNPDWPVFDQYFKANWKLSTNQLVAATLMALMTLFEPDTAEKIIVSIYVLFLPISMLYALSYDRKPFKFAVFLIFPFVFSRLPHMGFFNFSIGLVFFLFIIGYAFRHYDRPRLRHAGILLTLLIASYFVHIMAAACAVMAVSVLAVARLVEAAANNRGRLAQGGRAVSPAIWFGSSAVAATCVAMIYVILRFGDKLGLQIFDFGHWATNFVRFAALSSLMVFGVQDVIFALLFSLFLLILAILTLSSEIRYDRFRGAKPLLAVFGVFAVVFLMIPSVVFLPGRLSLFLYFLIIIWLGRLQLQRKLQLFVGSLCVIVAIGALAYRVPTYINLNNKLVEYASAASVFEPGATLFAIAEPNVFHMSWIHTLPAAIGLTGSQSDGAPPTGQFERVKVFLHAHGRLTTEARLVNLSNYQTPLSIFPLHVRPTLNPSQYIYVQYVEDAGPERPGRPPYRGFAAYAEDTGGQIDYVLLWEMYHHLTKQRNGRALLAELERDYDLVHVSKPGGFLRVYRRRP